MGRVMKQFNLEEYLNNPSSRTLVTRDGYPARIICTDALNIDQHPIIAQVWGEDGYEETVYYNRQGTVFNDKPTENDLFFAPERHDGWINIFEDSNSYVGSDIFKSKEDAEKFGKKYRDYKATIKIKWEK